MVVFNYSGSEINAKVVYYGPALGGKTTNLEHIYQRMPSDAKGKMVSMKTRTDRTLFFDFLPLELGDVNGYRTRILLYTVPGQVYYNATRKLVLKGADAVVFVADSDASKQAENIESLRNLEENLNELGLTLDTIPWVIQFNKRDLSSASPVRTLESGLNLLNVPSFEAVATQGIGVYETFQAVTGMLYTRLAERFEESRDPASADQGAAQPAEKPGDQQIDQQINQQTDQEENVSEVIDVALRQLDVKVENASPTGTHTDTTPAAEVASTAGAGKTDCVQEGTPAHQTQTGKSGGEAFRFASLEKAAIDESAGRMIDLEDEASGAAVATEDPATAGEFITDPCRLATAVEEPVDEISDSIKVQDDVTLREEQPPTEDECIITVPVLLSTAQIRKTIPIKLRLEVQIIDEDL